MILFLIGHTYKYECEKICRIYFPLEKIVFASENDVPDPAEDKIVRTEKTGAPGFAVYTCTAVLAGRTASRSVPETAGGELIEENALAVAMLGALTELTGVHPPWGVLTGVRPSKLLRRLAAERGAEGAKDVFIRELLVRPDKAELAARVAAAENEAIAFSRPESYSLYVSIPFCPSRCAYCSFVSHSIAQAGKLIPEYIRLLCEELRQTAALADALSLKLETVYIGGGTPTSIPAKELKTLFDTLNGCFDLASAREFTVEAGRPDTVDAEKLSVLMAGGAGRISINPQSFSDEVLARAGRRHTAREVCEKFALARRMGFCHINMDLIAGLAGDTAEGFARSVEKAVSLAPENITVHTLALKRAASLVTGGGDTGSAALTAAMVETANSALGGAGYGPYYMYRQSKSLGNLENVGWAKPGEKCLYNIYMMEETHSVFACGAGAITKLKAPAGELIERIYNFNYPYEYLSRFPELAARKQRISEFYEENR